jgi:hypothetical protein
VDLQELFPPPLSELPDNGAVGETGMLP